MLIDDLVFNNADTFTLYDPFLIAGTLTEFACAVCLIIGRVYRHLPVLTLYLSLMTVVDAFGTWVYMHGTSDQYWRTFVGASILDYLLELGLMGEFAWKLLDEVRPFRSSRKISLAFTTTAMGILLAATLSACGAAYLLVNPDTRLFLRFDLGFGILRSLVFLAIVWGTWIFGVRSNERIGRMSSYFSLYFFVALLTQIAHEYRGPQFNQYDHYEMLECFRIGTWCIVMLLVISYVIANHRRRDLVVSREDG